MMFLFMPFNKSLIAQACYVSMAEYGLLSLFHDHSLGAV